MTMTPDEIRHDRMIGYDCTYTGKGDGPYTIERDEYRNIYSLYRTNSDGAIMRPYLLRFEANDFGIDTAATARAMCWFLNERHRMQSRPSPRADWMPGGWRDQEVRDDEARSKEEAERERRGFIRDDSDADWKDTQPEDSQ